MDYFVDRIPFNMSSGTRKTLKNILYQTVIVADWACGSKDYRSLVSEHWTLALCALLFTFCSLLTLCHALRNGGRFFYMWLAIFLTGIVRELMAVHLFPNGDLQWHSQAFFTFFGRRTPGYVLFCLYPTFMYTSAVLVKRLRLNYLPECILSAMAYTVARIPYEMLGAKFLWWTWHSDHPFVQVKQYHVPVAVLIMHFWTAVIFHLLYRLGQRLLLKPSYDWKLFAREIACCKLAALISPLVGYVVFENVFTVFQLLCSNGALGVFALTHMLLAYAIISGRFAGHFNKKIHFTLDELNVLVVVLYVTLLTIAAVALPEQVVSTGLHQPFGHCGTKQTKPTMLLSIFEVERFVCAKHVDKYEFDFHCVRPQPVSSPRTMQEWYTVCGKALSARGELVFIIGWLSAMIVAIQFGWTWFTTGGKQLFNPVSSAALDKRKAD